jgi:hypothetical protein
MKIIRECRMRADILMSIAKEAPELESQLLYVAQEWLALALLKEQLNASAGPPRAPWDESKISFA